MGSWTKLNKKVLYRTFLEQLTKLKYGLLIRLKIVLILNFLNFIKYIRRISLFSGNNTLKLRVRTIM